MVQGMQLWNFCPWSFATEGATYNPRAAITLGIGPHSSFFFFCLAYSQQSQTGCLPHFHKWGGLSVNSECRCEVCCTRFGENTRQKNYETIPICTQYGELRLTNGSDRLASSGHPVKFQQVLHLHFVIFFNSIQQMATCRPTFGNGFRIFALLL